MLTREAREKALAKRHEARGQQLKEHTRPLHPLVVGTTVQIQNQSGPHANKWDVSGTIVEVLAHNAYLVQVDGLGRVSKRYRRFLKPIVAYSSVIGRPSKDIVNGSTMGGDHSKDKINGSTFGGDPVKDDSRGCANVGIADIMEIDDINSGTERREADSSPCGIRRDAKTTPGLPQKGPESTPGLPQVCPKSGPKSGPSIKSSPGQETRAAKRRREQLARSSLGSVQLSVCGITGERHGPGQWTADISGGRSCTADVKTGLGREGPRNTAKQRRAKE